MLMMIVFWFVVFWGLTRFDFYNYIVPFHSPIGIVLGIVVCGFYALALFYIVRDIFTIKKYYKEKPEKIEEESINSNIGNMGMLHNPVDRKFDVYNSYVSDALRGSNTFSSSVGILLKEKLVWFIQSSPIFMYLLTGILWNFIQ